MLFSGGVKLFMDGSGGGRTAWVYEPWYKDGKLDGNNTGYPNIEPPVYHDMVKLFHDAGYHVSTHAVGDRAIDTVVDTYAALLKDKPTKGLRHGIIHANIPTDHAIDLMAQLQRDYDSGYPETQPPFMWWIGNLYVASFGPKREARLMPYKTYTQKNIIWAAHQLFLENRVGSVEPGKDADLAVWDRDLYSVPSEQLKDLKCLLTLLRGHIVYKAPDSPVFTN